MSLKERLRLEEIETNALLSGSRLPVKESAVKEESAEIAHTEEESKIKVQ
ncbi:hypothetical protein M899_0445 [Bacteriovorax sp. BSW11_IV]|nr:hypothetical protein [Bacteriovorax sp. BSW11_IV]EQC44930.1 hypothetical protein M899_0445 [Bacteriovorax sp. BSW11_IV]